MSSRADAVRPESDVSHCVRDAAAAISWIGPGAVA